MGWITTHRPWLAQALKEQQTKVMDFAFFKRFSYGCKQVFSGSQRWALTGEAGLFLDPFYSPGSDFIAMGNTFITELVTKDANQEPVAQYARIYERIYFQFYESMLSLYVDQYRLFGDATVMPLKVIWDYTYYWGVMCQLFFQNKLTDLRAMSTYQPQLERSRAMNDALQALLRQWNTLAREQGHMPNPKQMLDQSKLPWFAELNRGMMDELDAEGFKARMSQTLAQLDDLAHEIVQVAQSHYPELDCSGLVRLLGERPARQTLRPSMLFATPEALAA
jgi:hypothetical protein